MKEEQRKYNLTTTIAMIIGIVIGSGIFFKADDILLLTGGSVAVGCIVLILGAFSIIFGGMTIAEWAKITDDAGGLISYGEKAFGKKFAFFIGWFQMSVYFPTLASVVCWVGANYTIQLFSNVTWLKHFTWQLTLFYMILFFVINTCAPKIAGYLQTSATIIKIIPLIIIAILVRIKLGSPVIFKQERPGKNEKIFTLYKFRTMTNKKDENGNLLPDEKRLTKFGKILRSTSLDELPELFNILKGDMAIVGPRPLLKEYLPLYDEEQKHRHDVRPGLTGLAQISGRNSISWEEKFEEDIKYVKKITFINDVKIVLKTIVKVFKREGISQEGNVTIEKFKGKQQIQGVNNE